MLGYGKNNQPLPVEWKDLLEGPLGVAVQKSGRRQSGGQEGVAKKQSPRFLRLNCTQQLIPDKSNWRSGLESIVKWFVAKKGRLPPLAERPIPAKGPTHVHGLLGQWDGRDP